MTTLAYPSGYGRILGLSATSPEVTLKDGLKFYWDCNNSLNGSYGGKNIAALSGFTAPITQSSGGPNNHGYISMPNTESVATYAGRTERLGWQPGTTGAYSIAFWCRKTFNVSRRYFHFSGLCGYGLPQLTQFANNGDMRIGEQHTISGVSTFFSQIFAQVCPLNVWQFGVLTSSFTSRYLRFYANGSRVVNLAYNANSTGFVISSTYDYLTLGTYIDTPASYTAPLDMAKIGIWERELTQDEITALSRGLLYSEIAAI